MIDEQPVKTAARRRRREQRIGEAPRVCALCGHEDIENLNPVTAEWLRERGASQRFLEEHHVAGKQRDSKLTVPLCRNCHGSATERLAAAGIRMQAESDSRFRIAGILEALAVFFDMLVDALRRWARQLRAEVMPPVRHG